MSACDDARKAAEAATEIRAAAYDLTDVEHRRFVRDAVAAAAPILLAGERARIDRILWDLANEATSVLTAATLMAARRRIAETAPDVPMSPDKRHAETAPEEGP